MENFDFETELEQLQKSFKKRAVAITKPKSEFPELIVRIPDAWKSVILAPLYDVHIGSAEHDAAMFARHVKWIQDTPNVLTFNGGDMFDNITPAAAAKMGQNAKTPEQQLFEATDTLAPIQNKVIFSLPGNHEDRTFTAAGMSSARYLAENLRVPYFSDYCFCTLKWRGNSFRLLAHHGSGAATTPGAQRNSARKDMPWAKVDIVWTGHLHQPMSDVVYQTDYDQKTDRIVERNAVVLISPSYVKYFGGYAARKRLAPGIRGLSAIELQEDGRIDISMHASGKRL
jgi:UDP-2,3-diacylglucosamine pyrophosphatase LpxH